MDVVSTCFDGKKAVALRSDGTVASADSYDPGPNGFVVARWLLDKRTQELEFVNSCSVGGQLVIPRASQVISRRPARAMRVDKEPEDEPQEAEDAEDEDEEATQQLELKSNATEVHLRLAPSHRGSTTIVAKSTGKDKVQICQITETLCRDSSWDPSGAARHVRNSISRQVCNLLTIPVATSPALPEVRELARNARDFAPRDMKSVRSFCIGCEKKGRSLTP